MTLDLLPQRGRGRAPDPERTAQTRALILRSALAAFLESGFERTRMADVAARAGLAKGTLYLHFSDKEGLFEYVLEQLVSEPLARLREGPAPTGETPRALLERIVLPLLRDFESSGRASVLRLIIAEGVRFPALAAMHRRLVIEPMMRVVVEALGGADAPGPLRRFPQLVGAPVVMAAVWNGIWSTETQVDTAEMFAAFLDAVFGPDPRPGSGGHQRGTGAISGA